MRAGRVTRVALGAIALTVALVVAPAAEARPKVHPSGHALGLVTHGNAGRAPSLVALTSPLDYHGGPVLHGMTVRTIFWEHRPGRCHTFPAGYKTLVNRFYTDVAHDSGLTSNPYASVVQYPDGIGPAAYRSTFAGSFTVHDPLPTLRTASIPRTSSGHRHRASSTRT